MIQIEKLNKLLLPVKLLAFSISSSKTAPSDNPKINYEKVNKLKKNNQ